MKHMEKLLRGVGGGTKRFEGGRSIFGKTLEWYETLIFGSSMEYFSPEKVNYPSSGNESFNLQRSSNKT